jgi:hypothetical protein
MWYVIYPTTWLPDSAVPETLQNSAFTWRTLRAKLQATLQIELRTKGREIKIKIKIKLKLSFIKKFEVILQIKNN